MELSLVKSKQVSRKPMRLKDFLLDELSSCSSNGFRSYPRRPCCTTTVRLLVELDLKNKPPNYLKKPFKKCPSKTSSISALQKASNALINAMKHLPFASSASKKLSKNLLKRCFGKKRDDLKIQMQKPVGCISQESYSSMSGSNTESYGWLSSDFTASDESLGFSSVTSDQVKIPGKNLDGEMTATNGESLSKVERVGEQTVGGDDSSETTAGSDSSNSKQKPRRNEEEKEQLSPVSVLDCPFEDDEDDVSSSFFPRRIARAEGNNKRRIRKIKGLERLRKLEPINLEKRIALSESDHQDSKDSPLSNSSQFSLQESIESQMEEDDIKVEAKALWLLQLMKGTMPISTRTKASVVDKLLLDFFKEGMDRTMDLTRDVLHDTELMKIANDWLKDQSCQMLHEREVVKNMEACLRDMEREGKWRKWNEERKEVVLGLEAEVFASLVNEVLDDYIYCSQP